MSLPTKRIALTNSALTALMEGLNAISQGRQITVDGKNVPRGFVFDPATSGETRYALARIGIVIKPLVEAFQAANDGLFRGHDPVSQDDKNGQPQLVIPVDRQLAYNQAVSKLFSTRTEKVELPLICYESLKVGDDKGQNPISPNAIAALAPVLVWTRAEFDAIKKDGKTIEEPDPVEPEQAAPESEATPNESGEG